MDKNKAFKLGRSIAQIVPFQVQVVKKQIVERKDKIPFKVIIAVSLAILIIKIVLLVVL